MSFSCCGLQRKAEQGTPEDSKPEGRLKQFQIYYNLKPHYFYLTSFIFNTWSWELPKLGYVSKGIIGMALLRHLGSYWHTQSQAAAMGTPLPRMGDLKVYSWTEETLNNPLNRWQKVLGLRCCAGKAPSLRKSGICSSPWRTVNRG